MQAQPITLRDGELAVPDHPVVPYIEGDGTGPDIWRASVRVFDAAVAQAYDGRRRIGWHEVLAGEKAHQQVGQWLPPATIDAFRQYLVGIKGPLTTPVGEGFRSLNVDLRQRLDLYACVRPVRWYRGVPSPVRHPDQVDMVIFRESTEDVYAGYEVAAGTPQAQRLARVLRDDLGWHIGDDAGIGVKPISEAASKRLVRAAVRFAVAQGRDSVTVVHKGNIMKHTEGAFMRWAYEVVRDELADVAVGWDDCGGKPGDRVLVKDVIADAMFQMVLLRPAEHSVIATMNLNGDYLSDSLAAQVGGLGIAPGGNVNYETGVSLYEATHGTAPKYAGQDKVNPSSVILSGETMLRRMGWHEAADLIVTGLEAAFLDRVVTYDFARLLEGATEVATSEFADAVIARMDQGQPADTGPPEPGTARTRAAAPAGA